MNNNTIGKIEAISLIVIIAINSIILNIPKIIVNFTGSSSLLNMLFVSSLAIVFGVVVCKLFKPFSRKNILDISEFVGGKTLKIILGLTFIIFFIFVAALSARYLGNIIKIIYFNNSPLIYLLLFFFVPAVILNKLGLKSISGINLAFIFIIVISLLFIIVAPYKNFSFYRFFPILGNGFNSTFITGSSNIFAFTGLAYLYFFPSLLKDSKDLKKVTISSLVISSICLTSSVAVLILTFPAATQTDEILSIYILTRMIEFGNFLERFDALFIFVLFLSLLSFLSLTFFYILNILKEIFKLDNNKALASPLGLIVLASCLIFKNYAQMRFFINYVYRYFFCIFIIGIRTNYISLS